MARVQFKEYLHDEWEEAQEIIFEAQGIDLDDEFVANLGRPFYEVQVLCELDTETGEMWATHFEGVELTKPVKLHM